MNYFITQLKNIDKILLVLPLCFAAISLLFITSVTYKDGMAFTLSNYKDVIIQGIAFFLGFICMGVTLSIDYTIFQSIEKYLYIGSILFLLSVYVPGLGVESYGARAWLNLGFTTFQPSEIVKITFVLLFANYLQRNRNNLKYLKDFIKAFLYALPFIAIIGKEDLGSGLVFCAIWILMVFFAGIDMKIFARVAGICVVSLPILYRFMASHQKQRIDAFIHPNDLSITANYQVWQSKVAIGSGGFLGKGIFRGTQKGLDFLPVQKSDFIFSVICEETGFMGGAVVIALYSTLIYKMCRICHEAKDLYGALIVMGFIAMFGFQIFENIAMTMGLMPVAGITLPFISYGGSSILSGMIALGLVYNVHARTKIMSW